MANQHPHQPPTHPPTKVGPTEVAPSKVAPTDSPSTQPTVHLDVDEWLPYLDDPDATDEEKRQLIETLWGIVLSFVDLGWSIETDTSERSNLPPETMGPTVDLTRALHAAVVQLDEPNLDHQEKEEV